MGNGNYTTQFERTLDLAERANAKRLAEPVWANDIARHVENTQRSGCEKMNLSNDRCRQTERVRDGDSGGVTETEESAMTMNWEEGGVCVFRGGRKSRSLGSFGLAFPPSVAGGAVLRVHCIHLPKPRVLTD